MSGSGSSTSYVSVTQQHCWDVPISHDYPETILFCEVYSPEPSILLEEIRLAPVEVGSFFPLFSRLYTSQVTSWISEPSTVSPKTGRALRMSRNIFFSWLWLGWDFPHSLLLGPTKKKLDQIHHVTRRASKRVPTMFWLYKPPLWLSSTVDSSKIWLIRRY